MRTSPPIYLAGVLLTLALFSPGAARADANLVANGSFETTGTLGYSCGAGCSYSWDSNSGPSGDSTTISDWTLNPFTSAGVEIPGNTALSPVPDGVADAFINGGTVQQTLGATAVVGDTYTLSGWIANYSGPGYNPSVPQQSIALLICDAGCGFGSYPPIGNPVYASATGTTTGTATSGALWHQVSATFVMPATGPGGYGVAGDALIVQLFNQGGSGQGQFDAISLVDDSTIVTPEPGYYGALLLSLAGLMVATRFRRAKQLE